MKIIIAGAGAVGTHLARLLGQEQHDITLMDADKDRFSSLRENTELLTIEGRCTSLKDLENANINKADLFIAVTPEESQNITACMLANKLGAKKTLARIDNYEYLLPKNKEFFESLGIHSMIYPEMVAAKEIALAIELFTHGSLNTFAKQTNVDTHNRLICYDILDLGKQLMPIGMLVVLDSILNRITQNRAKGKHTFIFIDEIYLLFQHEYSANFLFTLWKRVRKYGAYATGITQNVDDLLQSHTARTMLANSEFIIMLNQASTDRLELAKLLNISDLQLSYITNVDAGHGLIKVGSSLVPFANKFPKNTKLYRLMTTKPGEGV